MLFAKNVSLNSLQENLESIYEFNEVGTELAEMLDKRLRLDCLNYFSVTPTLIEGCDHYLREGQYNKLLKEWYMNELTQRINTSQFERLSEMLKTNNFENLNKKDCICLSILAIAESHDQVHQAASKLFWSLSENENICA